MKLLHFADLHLGVDNYGSLNPRTGLSTRIDDFLRAFDTIIDTAINERVDAVLFAGDAFKNRDPSPTLQRMFAERVRRLSDAQIPTVLLTGNHDMPTISARATAVDIYETLSIPNIHPARKIGLVQIETNQGPLQVATLPWIPRNRFALADDIRNLPSDQQAIHIAEGLSGMMRELAGGLDHSLPAVLVAHLSLEGARLGSEQSIMLGNEMVLSPTDIGVDAFDYVALGHVHRHQSLGTHPPVVYAGSPERVDFGEERETKGYVIVDLDRTAGGDWEANWKFIPLPTRPFLTIEYAARTEDPMEEVRTVIDRRQPEIEESIVRMTVTVPSEREGLVRVDEIRRWLQAAGAAWVARVNREADTVRRVRVDIRDEEALDPEVMLDRWLSMRDLPDETRERVRAAGLELIRSERDNTGQA